MGRKKRPEGTRAPNGASSIYLGKDEKWHGRVTMGVRDDGKPDRRHVQRATEAEVIKAVRKLEQERDSGTARKPGRAQKVEQWLLHWLENIARPSVKYKAYQAYSTAVHRHLIPGVGSHRIDKIEPEHFEKLYALILKGGKLKPATAHQVHRTARTAFGEATRRGIINRNPVALAKAPRVEDKEIEPFDIEEIQRLIKMALTRRNGVRFVLALALGTRQGETIGLKWTRLDKRTKTLTITRQLQRRTWEHGCPDPHACGAKYHKVKPCKESCKRHTRVCPPPCAENCTDHARWCPERHGGGLVEADVKSKSGRRVIGLPVELYSLLEEHRAAQNVERVHAANEWHEGGWMFAQPTGRPIDPRRDLAEWQDLLSAAGVRAARLHDARHTAATVLLLLGVSERAAMDVMGWSHSAMAKRYMHVTDALRRSIADQVGGLLWGANETETETEEDGD
jgi:integrase